MCDEIDAIIRKLISMGYRNTIYNCQCGYKCKNYIATTNKCGSNKAQLMYCKDFEKI